jgi:peroxiredoxin
VFLVDQGGVVRYVQLVKELSKEPNYDEVLQALGKLT